MTKLVTANLYNKLVLKSTVHPPVIVPDQPEPSSGTQYASLTQLVHVDHGQACRHIDSVVGGLEGKSYEAPFSNCRGAYSKR